MATTGGVNLLGQMTPTYLLVYWSKWPLYSGRTTARTESIIKYNNMTCWCWIRIKDEYDINKTLGAQLREENRKIKS